MLHYETLEPKPYQVLQELMTSQPLKEAGFFLAGGTALALQLGHRMSTDLDLFTPTNIEPRQLKEELEKQFGDRLNVYAMTDLGIRAYIDGTVKIDMIHFPYANAGKPQQEGNIRYLPVEDIAAMKVHAIANRGARRDFVDLAEILQVMPLKEVMSAYKAQFDPQPLALAHTNRALTYFGDAEATPNVIKVLNDRPWDQTKAIVERSVRSPNFVHTTRAPKQIKASNPHLTASAKTGQQSVARPATAPGKTETARRPPAQGVTQQTAGPLPTPLQPLKPVTGSQTLTKKTGPVPVATSITTLSANVDKPAGIKAGETRVSPKPKATRKMRH